MIYSDFNPRRRWNLDADALRAIHDDSWPPLMIFMKVNSIFKVMSDVTRKRKSLWDCVVKRKVFSSNISPEQFGRNHCLAVCQYPVNDERARVYSACIRCSDRDGLVARESKIDVERIGGKSNKIYCEKWEINL